MSNMQILDNEGKTVSPMQFLQAQFPLLFSIHKLTLDKVVGGGDEKKLVLLIDVLMKYNQTKATGSIIIDYSKGYIGNIDTKVRVTAIRESENDYQH